MIEKRKDNLIEIEDLRKFLKIFSRNWIVILLFISVSFLGSYVYTHKLPDIYGAKAQVLLKNNETYDYQNQIYKGIGYYATYQDNANQIRVLTSNDLIAQVISKLNLDVSYFIIGRLKKTEVFQSVPFEVKIKTINPALYETPIKITIIDEEHFSLSYLKNGSSMTKKFMFNKSIEDQDFYMIVEKNSIINKNSIASLNETDYEIVVSSNASLVAKFKNNLRVNEIESTTILELFLEDEIPLRAISFLDTLSKVYIDYTSKSQIIINNNTIDNIDKQLKEITDVLKSIEDDMELYRSEKGILDINRQQDNYFEKLIDFDTKKRELELWSQSLESLQKYIISVGDISDEKLLPPSYYIEQGDDYLKAALGKLYTLQMDRNQRLNGSTLKNRNINEIDQELDLLKKNILTYIDNSKKGLKDRITDISKQIQEYTSIIKTVPKTQRDLLNIQRKLDVNQKMYSYLLEKRASTLIAKAGILPETNVIEAAHSVGIVAPNKRKITYYFLVISLFISAIIIFIRQVFYYRIENINELKRLTNIPVLGEIILNDANQENYIIVDKEVKSAITESFRAIRTGLEYFASSNSSKIVLLTSYNPGEGKTFCSVNLATILAKGGKKVLLLELDLHKPKVQKAFDIDVSEGITNVLIGKSSIESVVKQTHVENLSVMLAGPIPPNASELILSKHLSEIFNYGRQNFDYVIIDTPPIGLITDAFVMIKDVDISLFVINSKVARKQIINIVEEMVETNKFQNFALLLNGVKRNRSKYYYNYGYGYGYGYGNSPKSKK